MGSTPQTLIKDEIRHSFTRPFLCHGAVGLSFAVAVYEDACLHIWSRSHNIFAARPARTLAVGDMLLPDSAGAIVELAPAYGAARAEAGRTSSSSP